MAGAAEALQEAIELIAYPHAADRTYYDRQMAATRARLGNQSWEEAWADGHAMTTGEAVECALEKHDHQ